MTSTGQILREILVTELRRYQVQGVRFIHNEAEDVGMIADDMGLGKTIQGIAWIALLEYLGELAGPVVVVVPATVKEHWRREFKRHAGLDALVLWGRVTTPAEEKRSFARALARLKKRPRRKKGAKRRPRSRWQRMTARQRASWLRRSREHRHARKVEQEKQIARARRARIVILNYDVVKSWLPHLLAMDPDAVILDECHRIKNLKAQRTKACTRLALRCSKRLALSGTPILNAPVEYYPVLRILRPAEFEDFWDFAFKYCSPKKGFRGGWDFSGHSNTKKLNRITRDYVIRRLKRVVAPELPRKQRIVIPVELSNRATYVRARDHFAQWFEESKGTRALRRARGALALVKLGQLLSLAALGKLASAIEWVRDFLEENPREKLVIFAVHREVVDRLRAAFPGSAVITGGTPMRQRQREVDRFRESSKCRTFLGNLQAAGEGVDGLQVASTTLTLEFPWHGKALDQSEDRVLRIGQTAKRVLNYYLVGRDTVEEWLLELIQDKGIVVDEVLEGRSDQGRGSLFKLMGRLK